MGIFEKTSLALNNSLVSRPVHEWACVKTLSFVQILMNLNSAKSVAKLTERLSSSF